jgi:hypothetical protein
MNPQYYSIDDELERYEEAARFKGAGIPDTPSMADAVAFNAAKNVEEVYTKMPNGGHVKIAERSITDEASLKRYDTALRDAGVTPSVEDYYAAGFDDDQINAAGLAPKKPTGGRTEPLTDYEKLYVERQGGEVFETQTPTMRENVVDLTYMNSEGDLRKVFSALGIDEFTARQIAEGIWGNPESSRGDLGMGAADFLPSGLLFGAQEGMRTYQRGISSGDYLTAGAGALEAGLSFLEALPLTAAGAKGLKKQIPVFRNALAELGQTPQASRVETKSVSDLDAERKIARQAFLDNPDNPEIADEYRRISAEYKSAKDAISEARATAREDERVKAAGEPQAPDTSYRMEHQPRGPEDGEGIRLDDLTKNISGEQAGYPDDFYTSQGMRLYAQGPSFEGDEYGLANQESYEIIASVKGNPDAEVTIYRAVPDEDAITTINPGDFVTLSPTYAKLHGASGYGRSGDEAGKVLEQKVKVRDIYWDGNDVNEFGYFPEEE